ncbi:hypothetical protein BC629DRAFT_733278 [Irpex lacteus]|nr:hypothetical protein BC629DRAFT_733278 [Irpex lacteus]
MGPPVSVASRRNGAAKPRGKAHEEVQEDTTYTSLLESIRATIAKTSIAALFTSPHSDQAVFEHVQNDNDAESRETPEFAADATIEHAAVSPSSSHRNSFFGDAKRMIKDISPSRLRARAASLSNGRVIPQVDSAATRSRSQSIHHISASESQAHCVRPSEKGFCMFSDTGTPLLTPDSSQAYSIAYSGSLSSNPFWPEDDGEGRVRTRKESEMIRAGKRPERPAYNGPAEDLSTPKEEITDESTQNTPETDSEDWYGLEETLEISMRDRITSGGYTPQVGECSKSFESWVVMHNGYVHPNHAQREYRRWRKWRKHLDLEMQKKERVLRTFQFLRDSKKLADVYLEERYRRDWFEYERAYGKPEGATNTLKAVQSDLAALSSYRPDPYYPAVKHNLAWVLKTSRSASCLRELQAPSNPA